MGDESPEKLVDFVKTATDSVKHVLNSPLQDLTTSTTQKPYTRRRLKKGLNKTLKKLKMERQHRIQQYEVQEMYTSSMLNAAPICFGDNNTLFSIVNGIPPHETPCVSMPNNTVGTDMEIPSTEQFLNAYIPSIGSPRENMQLSNDIYGAVDDFSSFGPQCTYETNVSSVCHRYLSVPVESLINEYQTSQPCNSSQWNQGLNDGSEKYNKLQPLNDINISQIQNVYSYPGYEHGCDTPNDFIYPDDDNVRGNADLINTLVDEENLNQEALEDILAELETTISSSLSSSDSLLSGFDSDISSDRFTSTDDCSAESSTSDSGLALPAVSPSAESESCSILPSFLSTFC